MFTTVRSVRRGMAFELWLTKEGIAPEQAAAWAAHAVYVNGYVAGRYGKVLYDATTAELDELARSGWVDWEQVGPAVVKWFEWLHGGLGGLEDNPAQAVATAPVPPRLRLVRP